MTVGIELLLWTVVALTAICVVFAIIAVYSYFQAIEARRDARYWQDRWLDQLDGAMEEEGSR